MKSSLDVLSNLHCSSKNFIQLFPFYNVGEDGNVGGPHFEDHTCNGSMYKFL
jgi:hypothetical protein